MIYQNKPFDFEERSRLFARNVNLLVKKLPKNVTNIEYSKQLVRSAGSIGANYIESKEALGKRDSIMHLRISKKESKESTHWLKLIDTNSVSDIEQNKILLITESEELFRILCSMIGALHKT